MIASSSKQSCRRHINASLTGNLPRVMTSAYSSAACSRSLNTPLSRHCPSASLLDLERAGASSSAELMSMQKRHAFSCATRSDSSERNAGSSGERLRSSAPWSNATPRNTRGERPHSSADFNTWPYLRLWFQKNGRRYQRYCRHGFSAILMRAPVLVRGSSRYGLSSIFFCSVTGGQCHADDSGTSRTRNPARRQPPLRQRAQPRGGGGRRPAGAASL